MWVQTVINAWSKFLLSFFIIMILEVNSHQYEFIPSEFSAPEGFWTVRAQQSLFAVNLVFCLPCGQTLQKIISSKTSQSASPVCRETVRGYLSGSTVNPNYDTKVSCSQFLLHCYTSVHFYFLNSSSSTGWLKLPYTSCHPPSPRQTPGLWWSWSLWCGLWWRSWCRSGRRSVLSPHGAWMQPPLLPSSAWRSLLRFRHRSQSNIDFESVYWSPSTDSLKLRG